jgi:hypothetical protein
VFHYLPSVSLSLFMVSVTQGLQPTVTSECATITAYFTGDLRHGLGHGDQATDVVVATLVVEPEGSELFFDLIDHHLFDDGSGLTVGVPPVSVALNVGAQSVDDWIPTVATFSVFDG